MLFFKFLISESNYQNTREECIQMICSRQDINSLNYAPNDCNAKKCSAGPEIKQYHLPFEVFYLLG